MFSFGDRGRAGQHPLALHFVGWDFVSGIWARDSQSLWEDGMVEINESERKKEKRIKRNEDNLRDLRDNVKCPRSSCGVYWKSGARDNY